ncbi:uncharacterized protein [Ptychodera flava]|uniref:uncharacterized protein n=1 Tax=Ptychodera flava TaxID=63121 RepID=UPI00396A1195
MLVSVTLPNTLPGENTTPTQQTNLSMQERREKQAEVFDGAIKMLNNFWRREHDGFPITPIPVPCMKANMPYNDHEDVEKLFKKGIREILTTPAFVNLRQEYVFLVKHCVRRTYMLEFVKCNDPSCSHCSCKPIRAKNLISYIKQMGGQLPTPGFSHIHAGHYMTWLEMNNYIQHLQQPVVGIDKGCPSIADVKVCPRGCQYVISSVSDGEKHDFLVHYTERQSDMQKKRRAQKRAANSPTTMDLTEGDSCTTAAEPQSWLCTYKLPDGTECRFMGETYYQLRKHKHQSQHFVRRRELEFPENEVGLLLRTLTEQTKKWSSFWTVVLLDEQCAAVTTINEMVLVLPLKGETWTLFVLFLFTHQ